MNESEINRIFRQRYSKAVRWTRRFHQIYLVLCLSMPIMGLVWLGPYFWIMVIIPSVCYPIMYFKLFSRWSKKALKKILTEATETTQGEVLQRQAASGIHQINYTYSVNGKKYKAYDIVNPQQFLADFYEGLKITVRYNPDNPKISYIEI